MAEIVIPSNPTDLKKLFDGVKEIADSKVRVDGESDFQKEVVSDLSEELGVPKSEIKRMATDYHKDTFKKNVDKHEQYQELYEATMQAGQRKPSSEELEDGE